MEDGSKKGAPRRSRDAGSLRLPLSKAIRKNRGIAAFVALVAAAESVIAAAWDIYIATTIVTFFSVIVAPAWYVIRTRRGESAERGLVFTSVRREMKDNLQSLSLPEDSSDVMSLEVNGRVLRFTNRHLNHDFYDSLKNSGRIIILGPELRLPIQSVFRAIESHNVWLAEALRITHEKGEPHAKEALHLFVWRDKAESDLRKSIPAVIEMLDEWFYA